MGKNIAEMAEDEFAPAFIEALLREEEMKMEDIEAAYVEGKKMLIGAVLLQALIDGKVNAKWDGKEFHFKAIK
ncbi:MAG: hypothetical protein ACFFDI_25070 [Promethearchaeota archaeon]